MGALRNLFLGGNEEHHRHHQQDWQQERLVGTSDDVKTYDSPLGDRNRKEGEEVEQSLFDRTGNTGADAVRLASDVAPGMGVANVSEGLGRMVGTIAGVLEKVAGGGGGEGKERGAEAEAPAGPDIPVVPFTSTAEIIEARRQE